MAVVEDFQACMLPACAHHAICQHNMHMGSIMFPPTRLCYYLGVCYFADGLRSPVYSNPHPLALITLRLATTPLSWLEQLASCRSI